MGWEFKAGELGGGGKVYIRKPALSAGCIRTVRAQRTRRDLRFGVLTHHYSAPKPVDILTCPNFDRSDITHIITDTSLCG